MAEPTATPIKFEVPVVFTDDTATPFPIVFAPQFAYAEDPPRYIWHVTIGGETITKSYPSLAEMQQGVELEMLPVVRFVGDVERVLQADSLKGAVVLEQRLSFATDTTPITGFIRLTLDPSLRPVIPTITLQIGTATFTRALTDAAHLKEVLGPWQTQTIATIRGLQAALAVQPLLTQG